MMGFCKTEAEEYGSTKLLQQELASVEESLALAEELFNFATEDALIEAVTYRIKTLQTYRGYLLRTARQQTDLQQEAAVTI